MIEISLWKYATDRKMLLWYQPVIQGKQKEDREKEKQNFQNQSMENMLVFRWEKKYKSKDESFEKDQGS